MGKAPSQVWVGDPELTMGSPLQEHGEKAGPGPLDLLARILSLDFPLSML